MELRVVKSIPIQEVQSRIDALKEKYGSQSHLYEEFSKGRMPPGIFEDYIEWTSMDHAIKAYQEGEDFEYLAEEDLTFEENEFKLLTLRRLQMLDFLGEEPISSINELSEKLGRDVKNVYKDLKILESLGFVALRKEGRRFVPEQLVFEINILL